MVMGLGRMEMIWCCRWNALQVAALGLGRDCRGPRALADYSGEDDEIKAEELKQAQHDLVPRLARR